MKRNVDFEKVVAELAERVGADVIVAPDAQNVARHQRDYGVAGDPSVRILALAFPRTTQHVAEILRYCNERLIPVQPQGGMTGLSRQGRSGRTVRRVVTRTHACDSRDRHGGGRHHG